MERQRKRHHHLYRHTRVNTKRVAHRERERKRGHEKKTKKQFCLTLVKRMASLLNIHWSYNPSLSCSVVLLDAVVSVYVLCPGSFFSISLHLRLLLFSIDKLCSSVVYGCQYLVLETAAVAFWKLNVSHYFKHNGLKRTILMDRSIRELSTFTLNTDAGEILTRK